MPTDNRGLTPEQKARAVQMYEDGAKTTAIYQETGVSRPALYMLLEQQGISPNRQRGRRFTPDLNADQLLRRLEQARTELGLKEAELAAAHARISELEEMLEFQDA